LLITSTEFSNIRSLREAHRIPGISPFRLRIIFAMPPLAIIFMSF
jgi:hypothetical protein